MRAAHSLSERVRRGSPCLLAGLAVAAAAALSACGGGSSAPSTASTTGSSAQKKEKIPTPTQSSTVMQWSFTAYTPPNDWAWQLPDYFAPPRVPADNPMTQAKVNLGRYLFYDKRLSGNGTIACGSCHQQSKAFSDGKAKALGATGIEHVRGAMALVNVAWNATFTWANPAISSLERQIPNPIFGNTPVEMGVDESNAQAVLQRLMHAQDVDYPAMFAEAFAPQGQPSPPASQLVTWGHIAQAITSFERTLVSVNSRYDQYLQGKTMLNASELRGMALFKQADCIKCHSGPNFTNQFVSSQTTQLSVRYDNKGLYNVAGSGAYPAISAPPPYGEGNQGAVEITGNLADMGAFKAPTLRNIEVTAPYTHDGSIATLEEAVDIFVSGGRNVTTGPWAGDGRASPHKSKLIQDRGLSAQDKADLVAFLKTLTDTEFLTNPTLSDPFAAPTP